MSHDSKNWGLLQTLFHLAEETPPDERERVLAEHCPDTALVQRALELFEGSAALNEKMLAPEALFKSTRIGSYTLLRPLGSGGIGTVYLAERIVGGAPQRVALKMLAPHAAGQSFIERFHREQHILGSLDHPGITRLTDAGLADSGQQYLVMEYVDGEHFDTYCDRLELGISQRLRLFLDVCDAVAYAHRSLIVHLDLKPSNILVSRDGAAKLLDFGTSKLIQTGSLLTTTIMATPAYSSPEQLRNEPVTTACDVYSLGAILFELLTGRRPYANSSVAAMIEKAVMEQAPENLFDAISREGAQNRGVTEVRLRQLLKGDLQTIVQKCLGQRPADRYVSVDALTLDLRRYLDGDPIQARPQTAFYRLGKFVRRHRGGVIAGVSAALILIGAFSYAFWRQQQALHEGQRAERMQTFMHQLFRLANSNYTGKPAVTVPEFLQLGVKILPDYIRNPEDLLQAKVALAESMFDNGDFGDAKNIFRQTANTARTMKDINAEAESTAFIGHIAFLQGNVAEGKQFTAEALSLSQQKGVSPTVRIWAADFYALDRDNLGLMTDENLTLLRSAANQARRYNLPAHEKAKAIYDLGSVLEHYGKLDEAMPLYSEALNLFSQDPVDVCDPSAVYGDLGYLHFLKNDAAGSVPLFQRSYDGYKTCSGAASHDALSILGYLGGSLVEAGRAPEAVTLLEASRPDWEKISGGFLSLGEFPLNLSIAYNATGRYADAEKLISAMIAAKRAHSPMGVFSRPEFILSQALAGEHRYQEALPHADVALRSFRKTDPKITLSPFGYTLKAQVEETDADIHSHLGLPKLP
jgi:tetratricopeptide (TPR) repeat protein